MLSKGWNILFVISNQIHMWSLSKVKSFTRTNSLLCKIRFLNDWYLPCVVEHNMRWWFVSCHMAFLLDYSQFESTYFIMCHKHNRKHLVHRFIDRVRFFVSLLDQHKISSSEYRRKLIKSVCKPMKWWIRQLLVLKWLSLWLEPRRNTGEVEYLIEWIIK